MPRRILPGLVRLGRRLRADLFRPPVEEEVDDEFAFHVEMRIREYTRAGASLAEAREAAIRRFGDIDEVKAACRRLGHQRERKMMRRNLMDSARQDVVFGLRQLARSPVTTAAAVITLTVGIGATTAVFGVVKAVVLDPLPYPESDRLVQIWTRYLPPSGFDIPQFPISPPELLDYREANTAFQRLGYYSFGSRDLAGDEGTDPQRVPTLFASHDVLEVLDVEPLLGRWFTAEEDQPDHGNVVLLSHDLWRSRFGGDPGILGREVHMSGTTATVVGVMPPEFSFPDASVGLVENMGLDESDRSSRGSHWIRGLGRLRAGVTLDEVRAEAETIHAGWAAEYEHNVAHFPIFNPLTEDVVGADVRKTLTLLLTAVAIVLFMAAVNVAGLLLARAEARQGEFALRSALGADRMRLVRQLLTESLTLAAVGGGLGALLAWWGTGALVRIDPTALPRSGEVETDTTILLFSLVVTVAVALIFGLAPALQSATPPAAVSGSRGGTSTLGRRRFRRYLVATEVALGVAVLGAAGLTVRSYQALTQVDPGVRVDGALTFSVFLPPARYEDAAAVNQFMGGVQEGLTALPGVRSASASSRLALSGSIGRSDFKIEGKPQPTEGARMWNAQWAAVLPDYFETAGVDVVRGRALTRADGQDDEPVVVVSEETARLFFDGEDPIGQRVALSWLEDSWGRIVGIVENTRTGTLDDELLPQIYFNAEQGAGLGWSPIRSQNFVVWTAVPPEELSGAVTALVREMDAALPVSNLRTMGEQFRLAVARPRLVTTLLGAFGLIALLLAAVGTYGVVSYAAARRTREMGIRIALGAERASVRRMVVAEGTWPAVVGVVVGVPLALLMAGALTGVLYGVSPRDPWVFTLAPAGLLLVAAVSSWIPATRGTRLTPTAALREE